MARASSSSLTCAPSSQERAGTAGATGASSGYVNGTSTARSSTSGRKLPTRDWLIRFALMSTTALVRSRS